MGSKALYVCVCNGVTEQDIRHAVAAGCRGMTELTMRTGCGSTCGSCVPLACGLLGQGRDGAGAAEETNVVPFRGIQHAA